MFGLSTSQWYGNREVGVEGNPQTNVQRIMGITISNPERFMVRVFSLKHSSTFVGNVGIYSVGTESVYQK